MYTAREQVTLHRHVYGVHGKSTRQLHVRVRAVCTEVFGRVHGAYTAPYTGRVHGHVRAMHTAVYTTRILPRTRVYVYKGRVHGRVRTIYTAENGRLHGRTRPCDVCVRAVSARVHFSVRAVCTAVFGREHWPCTLPISAVYIARTRPCNGPCTRPLHGRVQGPSGPCIRQVGLPGHVHVPRRHAAAVCGPCLDRHVHSCVWDVYTTVYMARYGRVHGPRP